LAVELLGGGIEKVKRRARFNHTVCVYLNIRWKLLNHPIQEVGKYIYSKMLIFKLQSID